MQARPSLEDGRVEEILDGNLLTESCDMEMMLKMGKPEPSKDYWRSSSSSRRSMDRGPRRSSEYENSQSFVSMDGVGFQRFRVEMDIIFFHSKSMKCFRDF
ncbi:hypothetical protein OIU78_020644 [Salix suchowensis]|nr:hypothetical protein OIU78_020644 [Salix suchowensis]